MKQELLSTYSVEAEGVRAKVQILKGKGFVPVYRIDIAELEPATVALLDSIKERLITEVPVAVKEILDPKEIEHVRARFKTKADTILDRLIPSAPESEKVYLVGLLLHDMLGLGNLEFVLNDPNLEEIVVNSSTEPVRVYHKEFGWLETNIRIKTEAQIQNYASIIARRVGRQITTLHPLLDAHLITGDRANATLFPISTHGNTITIRKFARRPWTITDFIKKRTITAEAASLIWLAMQYECNMIVSGGTASGKTSFLNVCMPFIQPYHRTISIEDTRELQIPSFIHWIPLTTREPNPEGKGEVSMLDLMVNSLRMRPDRIIVGEIRRQAQAEVLFEAMHTGHSVYNTLHANTAAQTIRRLVNPPISVPLAMLEAVDLNVVMFRDRRTGRRRMLQAAEFVPSKEGEGVKPNILYQWKPATDRILPHSKSVRLFNEISMNTGMSQVELAEDLKLKTRILEWAVKHDLTDLNSIGKLMALYYTDTAAVVDAVTKNKKPDQWLG